MKLIQKACPLTEVLREGARKMLALAIEAEVEEFISQYHTLKDEGQHRAIVRNGYPEERYSYWIRLNPGVRPRVKDRRKEVSREFSLLLASSLNLSKDQKVWKSKKTL